MGPRAQDLRCPTGAGTHPSSHREEGRPQMVCLRPEEVGDPLVHKWVTLPQELHFSPRGPHGIYTVSSAALNGALG